MHPSAYFARQPIESRRATYAAFFAQENRPQATTAFEAFFERIALMPEVVRANVYGADGTIIWSNHSQLVGHRFVHNEELQKALQGALVVKTGIAGKRRKAEHVLFDDQVRTFAESYIPIWNNERDTVIGVVEVYKVPMALFRAIAAGKRSSGAVLRGAPSCSTESCFGLYDAPR